MIKKCVGCGVPLQTNNKNEKGYTEDLTKLYCKRCFRLKNYGELERIDTIDAKEILNMIDDQDACVFFLLDYLNINRETIGIFKKIPVAKILVISKCDTLRKDMKYPKIKKWLNEVYKIEEDILFISKQMKGVRIFKYMKEHSFQASYLMGITNAGKSTLLNRILKENGIHKEVLVSQKENTTLDKIHYRIGEYDLYDTPGFIYTNLGTHLINKEIKPITYRIKGDTTIVINHTWKYYFKEENIVILYCNVSSIRREYHNTCESNLANQFDTTLNSDIVIPGVGYINVKYPAQVISNLKLFEIRNDLSGVEYE